MFKKSTIQIAITCIFLSLTAFECKDYLLKAPEGYEVLYLQDYTGLDGCGWIFENANDERFEPSNLNDYSIYLRDGKRYFVKYEILDLYASICMVGKGIRIIDIIDAAAE
ncbi:MAG: hypothetical protein JEY96_05300 [Bacteroidales bacterium]|nr:hypothetical protein [Bacteroidales bacterium]